ncbi:MAG: thioesterase family protein [Actinomycetota bacterium]|jgi:acyl-CoA thioesterase
MSSYAFDEDTALEAGADALTFRAGMSHRWDTVGPPNGGFLLALAARSLARAVPFPDPVTLTGHFLRPSRHTPVELAVETVRAGKAHATVTGRMLQDGKEILRTLATFSDLERADGPTESGGRPPALPPPEECLPVEDLRFSVWDDLPGRLPALYRSIDVRLGATDRREGGEIARLEGWMRFTDGREPDVAALPLLADVFPPAVLDIAHAAWVPTVELTVHVRARPAPGWIAASFRTKFLCDGYFEEDGELWDSTGQLVALSRQLAVTRTQRPSA